MIYNRISKDRINLILGFQDKDGWFLRQTFLLLAVYT